MMKNRIFIKRIILMALILTLSANSFAAIVSDNDGSSFVTKFEFEGMKKDFEQQIKNYNESIDNKIDGAIAAYLAGIKLDKPMTIDLPYKDWKKVTITNFVPAATYYAPNLSLNFTQDGYVSNNSSSTWIESFYVTGQLKYTRNATNKKKVVLVCDADVDSKDKKETNIANEPTNVQWLGRAKNYTDTLDISLTYNLTGTGSYLQGFLNSNVNMSYWARFTCNYYDDLNNSASTIWNPQYYYLSGQESSFNRFISKGDLTSGACTTSATLSAVDKETVDYEHMLNWDNLTGFRVCDTNWLKHLVATPGINSSVIPDWSTSSTETSGSGRYGGMEAMNEGGSQGWEQSVKVTSNRAIAHYWKGNQSNSASYSVPTIGLLSKSYSSNNLYQTSDVFSQYVDSKTYKTDEKPFITEGFIVCAANQNDKITWNPVFKDSKKGTTKDTGKIKLYLSVGPFGDNTSLKTGSKLIRDEKNNTDYWLINDLKGQVTFEMPENGIVYAKWCHESIPASGNWEITLDLTKCDSYLRVKGE